jgi:hypothetical protein
MMRATSAAKIFFLASAISFFGGAAFGQAAAIVGRVMDSSGAIVPGARTTAQETHTRLSREVISAADGYFTIPSLRPAEYSFTIEAPGFRCYVQEGLRLEADQTAPISITLTLGTTTETVTVDAAPSRVDLQTATLRQVVEDSASMNSRLTDLLPRHWPRS